MDRGDRKREKKGGVRPLDRREGKREERGSETVGKERGKERRKGE